VCCHAPSITVFDKANYVDCHHLDGDNGCGIYAERPNFCRAFVCLWLAGAYQDSDRPDFSGVLLRRVAGGIRVSASRVGSLEWPRARTIVKALSDCGVPLEVAVDAHP
jgi:hypothetical protein